MPFEFQVTVDAEQPHPLARWWAAALGWVVEPSDEAFIKKMVAAGMATEKDTMTFEGTLVWRRGAAIRHPGELGGGPHPRVLFQQVAEMKSVKNRLHLDIRVGQEQVRAEADRLIGLGASFLHDGQRGPQRWITLADPEGNELCVS